MTSFQFRTVKEKEKSLKALSVEEHNNAKYLAFSKRSSLLITLSSKILLFLSIQITHSIDNTIHFHITSNKMITIKLNDLLGSSMVQGHTYAAIITCQSGTSTGEHLRASSCLKRI